METMRQTRGAGARLPASGLLAVAVLSATVAAIPIRVDVENVPVDRVIANLQRLVDERPKDVTLRINLARVHAMAYAQKSSTIPSGTRVGRQDEPIVPWAGYFVPAFRQFEVKATDDTKAQAAARDQLTKAITRYREALELAPDNLTAKMGLGWTLSQSGDRAGAVAALRDVIASALPQDRKDARVLGGQRSLTEEAALYLIPLLDPSRDREEIDRLRSAVKELAAQPRPVTPIAVPLADGLGALDLVDHRASVRFDLDGSALPQRWEWIRPNAAWLVFDHRGTQSIGSGLQLFGSVTFWLFWRQGYDALAALDDNGDGWIAGPELTGFALWHDRNGNGRSDRGEVRPVADWDIVSVSCAYEIDARHPDEIAYSPRGVMFRDGTSRPTFDLVLRPAR
jgi:tetratricopeptide repeat protein